MYKVLPFQGYIAHQGSPSQVSDDLANIINYEGANGWIFVQIQELTTYKAGTNGCFGFGAEPGCSISLAVLIFRRA